MTHESSKSIDSRDLELNNKRDSKGYLLENRKPKHKRRKKRNNSRKSRKRNRK